MTNTAEHPSTPAEPGSTGVNLAEFLLARIAEDERAAYASGNGPAWLQQAVVGGLSFPANDAARNVDRCKALRRVVELHGPAMAYCSSGVWEDTTHAEIDEPCETLRLLALPYVDHPDYREEWRP
jgi:hypothetical protein